MDGCIRHAQTNELGALIELWTQVFGDEAALVDCFTGLWPCEKHAFILHRSGIESALWDIDTGFLRGPGRDTPLGMIYALATVPEHRGKGGASALMRALPDFDGLRCLTPAEASLAAWYKKLGWCDFFYCDKGSAAYSGESAKAERISAEAYLNLRETRLSGRIHDVPNQAALGWQSALFDAYGGGFFAIDTQYGTAAANVLKSDGNIAVSELLAPPQARQSVLDGLMAYFGASAAAWRAPAECDPVPFAMIPLNYSVSFSVDALPWLGFAFD